MNAKDLYWELSTIFSSPHNDTSMEMAECESELREALGKGHLPNYIITKMEQMIDWMRSEGDPYKSKLSLVIKNRFWEKSFVQMIPYKPFKIED